MNKERVLLHCDINNFYASVECLYNPSIREKPVAVGGDVESRHGIILAKNNIAKKFNIQTAEPIWQAKQKCPDLIIVKPHYDRYLKFSKMASEIYKEYTDQVESFGLDENWLDITHSPNKNGEETANLLRERIKNELGVTISVGVSFNKIFAKLGSDLKKPDAVTVISKENFKEKIWHLPANELLYVGSATYKKLCKYGVITIGQLAETPPNLLKTWFGKNGSMLWRFANGLDDSPVTEINHESDVKSIGNSTTTPHDLVSDDDIKITLNSLSVSVSARLREQGFYCKTVQLHVRDTNLESYERQAKLDCPNRTAECIAQTAYKLFKENHKSGVPIRSLGVRACDLTTAEYQQLSLLNGSEDFSKIEELETAIDKLRSRFGYQCVKKGIMLCDDDLSALDAKKKSDYQTFSYL